MKSLPILVVEDDEDLREAVCATRMGKDFIFFLL